jgi:hypothetical protein
MRDKHGRNGQLQYRSRLCDKTKLRNVDALQGLQLELCRSRLRPNSGCSICISLGMTMMIAYCGSALARKAIVRACFLHKGLLVARRASTMYLAKCCIARVIFRLGDPRKRA